MAEYIRGIKAGLLSGLVTAIILSILASILIYILIAPMAPTSSNSNGLMGFGKQDTLRERMITSTLTDSVLLIFEAGIIGGTLLGLIASAIVSGIGLRPKYTVIVLSLIFFFIGSIRNVVASGTIIWVIAFAAIDGLLIDHFWDRFGPPPASVPAFSQSSDPPPPVY